MTLSIFLVNAIIKIFYSGLLLLAPNITASIVAIMLPENKKKTFIKGFDKALMCLPQTRLLFIG